MVGEIADDLTMELFDKIVEEEVNDTCDHVVKQVNNIDILFGHFLKISK